MLKYAGLKTCVDRYSKKKSISKKEAEETIRDILDVIKEELLEDNEGIQFVNFITLQKVERVERVGRNPKKPSMVCIIPRAIKLKAILGKKFNEKLNNKGGN